MSDIYHTLDNKLEQLSLPINAVLQDIKRELNARHELILQAPPGAGKTSVVPLALLASDWLGGKKILVLEPRRLAARSAAERMAQILGERVGETVGYRVRLDSRVGPSTRIEVITEGLLNRFLLDDPSLEDVGLIIFDEFHERSLDADLGLALALQGRKLFRQVVDGADPLKLLVMSATIDFVQLADLLGDGCESAPLVRSEGKQFPVDLIYGRPWKPDEPFIPRVVEGVRKAIGEEQGSVLVFLPGQREIRDVAEEINTHYRDDVNIEICPLYGDLNLAEQRQAIAPAPKGKRKVVLATAIAESSLTIEGISVVVDAGLSRLPVFDPNTGMTRLATKRLSKASSVQRAGRAGRLEAGKCYRLWSEAQQSQLAAFTAPEIVQADLAPLCLQLLSWGVETPSELKWLDPPPESSFNQALDLLAMLGAVESKNNHWVITDYGQAMAIFPAHPRLAHMLIQAKTMGDARLGAQLAVLLSERDPLKHPSSDIRLRVQWMGERPLNRDRKLHDSLLQKVKQFERLLERIEIAEPPICQDICHEDRVGLLVARVYPDRVASRRNQNGRDYKLVNGRACRLREEDNLQKYDWLSVAQVVSHQGSNAENVLLAAPFDADWFNGVFADRVIAQRLVTWDKHHDRFSAKHERRVGQLLLSSERIDDFQLHEKSQVLFELVRNKGWKIFGTRTEAEGWLARVRLLQQWVKDSGVQLSSTDNWPDFSESALLNDLEEWLEPFLEHIKHIDDFKSIDLLMMLKSRLTWEQLSELDGLLPEKFEVPTGSKVVIDYSQAPPVLAVRIQEMFGCCQAPAILNGGLPLMIHLLSPARRPLQITQDLMSFWANIYIEVKKDMKGRYPKHYWPDDPLQAEPTRRTKPRK